MGGRAIKAAHGIETVRLEAKDYKRVSFSALDQLRRFNVRACVIPAYENKPDFGDADILYADLFSDADPLYRGELPENYFSNFPINVRNGNVTSVAWPMESYNGEKTFFQVDYIKVKPEEFEFAYGYFSYNDLGNLLGRVAHRLGLKFGHDGLWVTLRDGDHVVEDICVTLDFDAALRFLGYPAYKEGQFKELEDIFAYVTRSEYFARDMFPLEHRNTKARMRDRKRPSYTKFLEWLDAHPEIVDGPSAPVRTTVARQNPDMWVMELLAKAFPGFAEKLLSARTKLEAHRIVASKFNGEIVAAVTGLEGKELGAFIADFKKTMADDPLLFQYWVLSSEESTIRKELVFFSKAKEIMDVDWPEDVPEVIDDLGYRKDTQ